MLDAYYTLVHIGPITIYMFWRRCWIPTMIVWFLFSNLMMGFWFIYQEQLRSKHHEDGYEVEI